MAKKQAKSVVPFDQKAVEVKLDALLLTPAVKSQKLADKLAPLMSKILKASAMGHSADVIAASLSDGDALKISAATVRKVIADAKAKAMPAAPVAAPAAPKAATAASKPAAAPAAAAQKKK